MSTVSESKPWWAMTSAENPLGIDSQPFTTASPRAQIVLSVFSLTSLSSPSGVELGAADRAEVAPATDSQVFGDRKSTRLNSSHGYISYAVFCLKKKKKEIIVQNVLHIRI